MAVIKLSIWSRNMSDKVFMFFQKTLPKRLLTEFLGFLANIKGGSLTTGFIKYFIRKYKVDMSEAVNENPSYYPSFNSFFTREIKKELRPFANSDLISPVDGAVSQIGLIKKDQIFQAKGKSFTIEALLGGDKDLANVFRNGLFATLYLSPKDYHRIHMPCAGKLLKMIYIPGDLYSVNPLTAQNIDALFARNERVVCVFEGERGPFALVLVGATVVGSIKTSWHGIVNSPRPTSVHTWEYDGQLQLEKGEEMGQFLLGSTVVLVYPENSYEWHPSWLSEKTIRLGEAMSQ